MLPPSYQSITEPWILVRGKWADVIFKQEWLSPLPLLFPQDAGGQQIGFLLGSCGIALALTTEVCLKGLPKTQNGEIVQFKG